MKQQVFAFYNSYFERERLFTIFRIGQHTLKFLLFRRRHTSSELKYIYIYIYKFLYIYKICLYIHTFIYFDMYITYANE